MMFYYLLIIAMTLIASFAGLSLKKSTDGESIISIVKNKYLYIGGFLYVIAALLNVWILKKLPFSAAVPLGSFTYVWTMIIAGLFLKEKIGIGKIIGVLFIIAGVVCIAV